VKGIIFDMDGVLVDAMPYHCKALQMAIKQQTNMEIDDRIVFLLEGMPADEIIKEIFRSKGYNDNHYYFTIIDKIHKLKKEILKQILVLKPIDGIRELITQLDCIKAVVSGASKEEVETILYKIFGRGKFEIVITGDDLEEGKPNPAPFRTALERMDLKPQEAIVVENAPLGVQAANKAGIECIVTLNNSMLKVSDFKDLIDENRIFKDTKSASSFLKNWCYSKSK
jgi:HAD superfamily hydrolase (TIGR01509 family)